MKFSARQKTALTWWTDKSPWHDRDMIICDGAVRSGKTLCMSLGFVLWSMTCFRSQRFALCGKTIGALRRNILSDLLPLLRALGFSVCEHVTSGSLTIRRGSRQNTYYLFGGRDESSAALIQGVTLAGVLFDEVVLMPRSFVEQACARCSVAGSRLWFSCNPEGPGHWFYTDYIQKAGQRRALHLHFTMHDNPALSSEVRDRYARMYSGTFYRRFVLGQWVAATGRVYDFFRPDMVREPPEEPCEEYRVSCDYGTVNPASFGLWGRSRGVWYRLREYYWDSKRRGRQKTDAEYAGDLLALIGDRPVSRVIVDPSAASFIEELRRLGLPVCRANNDVLAGIRATANALKNGRIVICGSCTDCLRELGLYRWEPARDGRDRVCKENDHAMDDMRYFAVDLQAPKSDFAALAVARQKS